MYISKLLKKSPHKNLGKNTETHVRRSEATLKALILTEQNSSWNASGKVLKMGLFLIMYLRTYLNYRSL